MNTTTELLPLTDLGQGAIEKQREKGAELENELSVWALGKKKHTKKSLVAKLEENRERLSYLENLFSRFHQFMETGRYEWTESEQAQIQELATALQQKDQKQNLFGRTRVEESLKAFEDDQLCICSWRHQFGTQDYIAPRGQQVIAELTLTAEARKEAFRLAGIEIPVPEIL